jgi:hypothetical protein
VFDCAATDGYIPTVFAWNAPAPANSALRDGLLAAVARFPHLAGRFAVDDNGRKCIHLNDAGVLVLEATAATDLAVALPNKVTAHISELYPNAENVRTYTTTSRVVQYIACMHGKYFQFFSGKSIFSFSFANSQIEN